MNKLTKKKSNSPRIDEISYDIFKYLKKEKATTIFSIISLFFIYCYDNNIVPEGWLKGKTILIPKKDSHLDLNNWRPITLLSTIYKAFTLINNDHIKELIKEI